MARDLKRDSWPHAKRTMNSMVVYLGLYILVLAVFVGFEVISKVPAVLHTPLMSGTNAVHGIVLIGAFLVLGKNNPGTMWISFIAVVMATLNVVGGFVVTDRMLQMFKKKAGPEKA